MGAGGGGCVGWLDGGEASAQTKSCQGEWDVSPASAYCSNTTIYQGSVIDAVTGENQGVICDITTSCSFDVTYGSGGSSSVTLTPSLAIAAFSIDWVYLLTICVQETTDSAGNTSYSARVYHGCSRTNEYTAKEVEAGQFHD